MTLVEDSHRAPLQLGRSRVMPKRWGLHAHSCSSWEDNGYLCREIRCWVKQVGNLLRSTVHDHWVAVLRSLQWTLPLALIRGVGSGK